jgi:hypothetical protein
VHHQRFASSSLSILLTMSIAHTITVAHGNKHLSKDEVVSAINHRQEWLSSLTCAVFAALNIVWKVQKCSLTIIFLDLPSLDRLISQKMALFSSSFARSLE